MSRQRPTSWMDEVGKSNASRPRPLTRDMDLQPFPLEIPDEMTPRSSRSHSFPASAFYASDSSRHQAQSRPRFTGFDNRLPSMSETYSDEFSGSPPRSFTYTNLPSWSEPANMDPNIDDMDPSSAKDLTEAQRMFNKMWHAPQHNAPANRVNALGLALPEDSNCTDEEDMERIRRIGSPPPSHVGMTEGRGKVFCVVGFKCWRSDIFVQRQNGEFVEPLKEMDIVVVEADRGTDLGTILFATNSAYKAERYCHILNTRHVREIVRSSINFSHYWRQVVPQMPTASAALEQGHSDTKQVRRKAAMHEIMMITDKEYIEVKAKRTCQHYVHKHQLNMEILDAEFQADYQKLTFFYFAPQYVTFNALVHDLYKCFKKRIWMSAVNNLAEKPRQTGPQMPNQFGFPEM